MLWRFPRGTSIRHRRLSLVAPPALASPGHCWMAAACLRKENALPRWEMPRTLFVQPEAGIAKVLFALAKV